MDFSEQKLTGPKLLAFTAIFWLVIAEPLRMTPFQGQVAAVLAVLVLIALPVAFIRKNNSDYSRPYMFLMGFLMWAGGVAVLRGFDSYGLQNMSIYVLFVVIVVLLCAGSMHVDYRSVMRVGRTSAFLGAVPFFIVELLGNSGGTRFIGTGAIPGIAAIGLVLSVSMKRTFATKLLTVMFVLVIFASLSRAYIFFALLCISVPSIHNTTIHKFVVKIVVRIAFVSVGGLIFMTQYPPLRDRFLVNDGKSIAGMDIGTSGRDSLWGTLWGLFRFRSVVSV